MQPNKRMKPEHLRNRILAADLGWIPIALAAEQTLSYELHRSQPPLGPFNFVVYVVCTVFAWVLLSENMHLDGFRGGWRQAALVSRLLLAGAVLMVLLLAVGSVSGQYVGRLTLSVFVVFLLSGFLCIRRVALRRVLRRYRLGDVHRVVILGSDQLASELAAKFNRHPELLCKVIGFLCPSGDGPALASGGEVVAGRGPVSTLEVVGLLRELKVDELVLAHPPASNEILNLVALCRQQALRVSLVPQPYELYLSRPNLLDLGGVPLLQFGEMSPPASARVGKRFLDLALGIVLGIAALPVVLTCGAVLRFSAGKAFRRQKRVGWGGRQFAMLRLNVDRDPASGSAFERMLCRASISELPQFWNVLRGEMSLVGPRPESPERARSYSAWQQQRLSVRPGITGLAQVNGLREEHASEDKTRLDLQYMLQPPSLLKDLSLLLETVWTLTSRLRQPSPPRPAGAVEAAPQSINFFSGNQPFPEMFQHAHRTQPGSD